MKALASLIFPAQFAQKSRRNYGAIMMAFNPWEFTTIHIFRCSVLCLCLSTAIGGAQVGEYVGSSKSLEVSLAISLR